MLTEAITAAGITDRIGIATPIESYVATKGSFCRSTPAASQSLAKLIADISTAFTPEGRFSRHIGNLLLQFI